MQPRLDLLADERLTVLGAEDRVVEVLREGVGHGTCYLMFG
jgi:hypothetical protein